MVELDGLEMMPVLDQLQRWKQVEKDAKSKAELEAARIKFALGEAEMGILPDQPEVRVTWKKTAKGYRTHRIHGMEVPE